MIEIKRRQTENEDQFSASLHPLLKRIYANRDIKSENELERRTSALLSFNQLYGMHQAVLLLTRALKKQQHIIIVGDFDADGATSTALSMRALRMLGFLNVDYLVPNRFEDGYGLSPEIVERAVARGGELIMTVDNGISSIQGVETAKKHGLIVIITDHHLPSHQLPNADAIVNPNLPQCKFSSKSLAGVGVAFYLMLALRAHLRDIAWFVERQIPEPNLAKFLDLVAFGTVADVVTLDKNNRILVYQGLQRIRAKQCCMGIQALAEVASCNIENLIASDFGFKLGPRLNAAGRLNDMSVGVELLLTDNLHFARMMATELNGLNQTRKQIEEGMKEEAIAICERLQLNQGDLPCALSLYQKEWHQGVIGILASRIKEQYHRPVIAFADENEELIKGSARSIPSLHMRDILDVIDSKYSGLIKKFGGHAMAAGLTMAKKNFPYFSEIFATEVRKVIGDEVLRGVLFSDGELNIQDFTIEIAKLIRDSGPWGQGFPEPLFDGKFKLITQKLVGEKHLKMQLKPITKAHYATAQIIDAIAFNIDLNLWPNLGVQNVELAYRLDINEFRGNRSLQLIVEHIKALQV